MERAPMATLAPPPEESMKALPPEAMDTEEEEEAERGVVRIMEDPAYKEVVSPE